MSAVRETKGGKQLGTKTWRHSLEYSGTSPEPGGSRPIGALANPKSVLFWAVISFVPRA